jgi:predicted nucleic acid-binding protein
VSFVLDNSVTMAWCFHDEQTPPVMELLDRVTETGAIAPTLWPLEALNGLYVAERRRRITHDQREQMAGFLRDLPVRLDDGAADRAWTSLAALADRFTLSLYDAAYLELAQRRNLPLATRDAALTRAAQAVSVEVLGH